MYALKHNSDKIAVRIIGIDIREDVVGKYWVDGFHKVPLRRMKVISKLSTRFVSSNPLMW